MNGGRSDGAKDKQIACLLVRLTNPSGCDSPMVCVELGTRPNDRDHGEEYPHTPEDVNGFRCEFGNLGLFSFVHGEGSDRKPGIERPSYQRLAWIDSYKLQGISRTLTKIEKTLTKFREVRGYPATWAENVLRFAEATGAKWIAFEIGALRQADDRDVQTQRWAFYEPGKTRWLLDKLANSWAAKSPKRDQSLIPPDARETDVSELVASEAN